jgi:hypothetical protein
MKIGRWGPFIHYHERPSQALKPKPSSFISLERLMMKTELGYAPAVITSPE